MTEQRDRGPLLKFRWRANQVTDTSASVSTVCQGFTLDNAPGPLNTYKLASALFPIPHPSQAFWELIGQRPVA